MQSDEIWFVGSKAGGGGFTQQQDLAVQDTRGNPVLAGGTIRKLVSVVVGRMESVQKKKLDMMWEKLFDVQDMLDQETQRLSFFVNEGQEATDGLEGKIQFGVGQRRAYIQMIAIQQWGNAEPSAIAMVEKELKEAYEDDEQSAGTGEDTPPQIRVVGDTGGDDPEVLQGSDGSGGEAVGATERDLQEEHEASTPAS